MSNGLAARGVLFDLDNTLFDRDRTFLGWAQWFVRERLHIGEEAGLAATVNLLVELDANGYGPKDILFQTVKERFPQLAEDVHALTTAFYEEHLNYVSLDGDTELLLNALAGRGIPWGIVTNGSARQMLKVRKLGLDRRTDCVYVSEVVGIRKPAPEIFLRAAGCLGVEPPEVVFVGDNPEADIAGAASVGMRTAWLRRGREWPPSLASIRPDLILDSLACLDLSLLPPPAAPHTDPHGTRCLDT
ncbi:MAG: HAD family hydrolase [Chloroflexota bacterium]|nr:HAD family hydrolase [Chloroflexota bacterium]